MEPVGLHGDQIALHVVSKGGGAARIRPAPDFAVRGVRVSAVAEGEDAVLIVVGGGERSCASRDAGAVAVVVVGVGRVRSSVTRDRLQPPGEIVGVVIDGGRAAEGFRARLEAATGIACVETR